MRTLRRAHIHATTVATVVVASALVAIGGRVVATPVAATHLADHTTPPTPILPPIQRTPAPVPAQRAAIAAPLLKSESMSRPGARSAAAPTPVPDTRTIAVQTHFTEPPSSDYGIQCRGVVTLTPECLAHVYGTTTFTGTLWGSIQYDNYGMAEVLRNPTPEPDGRPNEKVSYEGPDFVTGGVVGCGTGSYIIEDYDGYVDLNRFDPLTHSAPGFNKWRLRPGSGTGQLTNLISGEGVNHWTEYFVGKDGDSQKAGEGEFTGTITCRN